MVFLVRMNDCQFGTDRRRGLSRQARESMFFGKLVVEEARARGTVAYRSVKGRSFVERKATVNGGRIAPDGLSVKSGV